MKLLKHILLNLALFTLAANHAAAADVTWASGNTNWDATSYTWINSAANPTNYVPGNTVLFDDTASGATPILVTNTLVITNGSITVSNITKDYTITGPGLFTNNVPITKLGGGTLTIGTTNNNYGGTFAVGGGNVVLTTGSALGSASTGASMILSNGVTLTIGDSGNGTVAIPIVIAAGATVTNTANALGSGANGNISSGDASSVIYVNSSFTYGGLIASFPGTIIANVGTTRLSVGGNGSTFLGSSGANFIVNSTSPGLQPRNNNTTVNLGSLSGTGTLGGAQTPTGVTSSTTTYSVGGLGTSTMFGGRFNDSPGGVNPTTNFVALTKIGNGRLTLTNNSTLSGQTTVSKGTLLGLTGGSLSNSTLLVVGGATNGVTIATAGGQFTVSNLTYQSGGPTYALFNFGVNLPSTSVAPLQVQNNLNIPIGAGLFISVTGNTIPGGTYPLIKYSGFSGTAAIATISLPPSNFGVISNDSAGTKTLYLVVHDTNLVTSAADDGGTGTLRSVIASSIAGDVIIFTNTLSGQTILLTNAGGELLLNKNLTINGGTNRISIDGNGTQRVFEIANGASNVLTALTITNGYMSTDNGGGIYNSGTLIMNQCTLVGNSSADFGGGIYNKAGAILKVNQSTVLMNSSGADGGGLANFSILTVNQSTIISNSAPGASGGGILNSTTGTLNLDNSIASGNIAASGADIQNAHIANFSDANIVQNLNNAGSISGPAPIAAASQFAPLGNYGGPTQTTPPLPGSPAIDGCTNGTTFTTDQRGVGFPRIVGAYADIGAVEAGNAVPGYTYGIVVNTTSDFLNGVETNLVSLRNAIAFATNGATITFISTLSGTTILLTSGEMLVNKNLTIDASALTNGISINGNNSSRIFGLNSGTTNVLTALTLMNGNADGDVGGGIFNGGTLTVNLCTLTDNHAVGGDGGGIYNNAGTVTLNQSTLSGNHAGGFSGGGGILNYNGTVTLNQSTLSGNHADGRYGGGIYNDGGGTVTLNQSTLSGNHADGGGYGGGIFNNVGTVTLNQSTLSGNHADGGYGGGIYNDPFFNLLNLFNSIVAGNNALSDPNITGSASNPTGVNLISGLPLLAPLGNYGGPTQTMPPLPGSPAIDGCTSGTTFITDQRGLPRIVGAFADIGAVEGVYVANYSGPGMLKNTSLLGNGSFQFGFTNYTDMSLTVWASTNLVLSLNQWSNLGAPVESPAGTFQFTDPDATNNVQRFYRVSSP